MPASKGIALEPTVHLDGFSLRARAHQPQRTEGGRTLYLVEEIPRRHRMYYDGHGRRHKRDTTEFDVLLPWMYYVLYDTKAALPGGKEQFSMTLPYVLCRPSRLTGYGEGFYCVPIPNLSSGIRPCFHAIADYDISGVRGRIANVIMGFYQSRNGEDYIDHQLQSQTVEMIAFLWQKSPTELTKTWYEVGWEPALRSLEALDPELLADLPYKQYETTWAELLPHVTELIDEPL